MRAFRAALSATAMATLALGTMASAASINVSPTRLAISRGGSTADFGLTNEGASAVRFSVRAFKWDQTVDGAVRLTPTDDVIVFPQILTVASHEVRTVRVAFANALPAAEVDYRIVATELPLTDDGVPPPGLSIRSKLSMPLFVSPVAGSHDVAIENARATSGGLSFDVTERGTVHDKLQEVRVRGERRDGAPLFDRTVSGWYVLPNEPRRFDVTLPAGTCAELARVSVDAEIEGFPVRHATMVPTPSC